MEEEQIYSLHLLFFFTLFSAAAPQVKEKHNMKSNPRKSVHQQRASSSEAMNSSHFFAIVHHETIIQKKLQIPEAYAERCGDELSDSILITVGGRESSLGIGRDGTSLWLENGWPEFAEFYSLLRGNVLFFKCKNVRCFDVHIFGRSACEIDYPIIQDTDVDPSVVILSEEGGDDDSSVEFLGSSSQCRREDQPSSDGGDLRPGHSRKGKNKLKANCDNDQLRNNARTDGTYLSVLQEAENPNRAAQMFKPANPSFTMALQSYHLRGRYAYIPSEFSKHLKYSEFVKLQVQVYGGRVHCLKATERRKGRGMNMGKGFTGFFRDNNLKEGDVIVFELIEPESAKLKAWIFHASSFPHGRRPLTRNQGTGCSMERPSSSGIKKSGKKNKGKASVSDEPEWEDTKVYYSYRFLKSVKNASPGTKRALEAAQELKSENPSFLLILNASAFTNKRLYVPAKFWAIYLSKDFTIEVQDSDGRQWFFQSIHELKGGSYLSGGWNDFVADNDLKQGDVCVFELIKSTNVVLKVSAFHASSVEEEEEAED